MSDVVIRAEKLCKKYLLRHQWNGPESRQGFRHAVQNALAAPFHLAAPVFKRFRGNRSAISNGVSPKPSHRSTEEFWALKDISFEVRRGDVLGIIGRNGAGKSTLLKILSRITEPTRGRVGINGRVASLLEVGTGFHPELSGRENIYLNGAILGMTRAEVRRKFDEIVSFAEVDKFLDTPVKHYSSGMYVRLAFAVAAHLDPEVLIVDEVLAVGDAEFQRKCLGKMKEVSSNSGRTVLFVSHNMTAVAGLCNSAILLNRGELNILGTTSEVIRAYMTDRETPSGRVEWKEHVHSPGNARIRLSSVEILSQGGITTEIDPSEPFTVGIDFDILDPGIRASAFLVVVDESGVEVLNSPNLPSATVTPDPWVERRLECGRYRTECTLPGEFFNEHTYFLKIGFNSNLTQFEFATEEVLSFRVVRTTAMRREYHGAWPGIVRPRLDWSTTICSRLPESTDANAAGCQQPGEVFSK